MYIKTDENNIATEVSGRKASGGTYTDKDVTVGQTFLNGKVSGTGDLETEKLSELRIAYESELDKGANHLGKTFNCHSDNIHALSSAIEADSYPIAWPVVDGSEIVSLADVSEAGALKVAMYIQAKQIKNNYFVNKIPAIKACTTKAGLDAIDTNEGW